MCVAYCMAVDIILINPALPPLVLDLQMDKLCFTA